MHHLRTLASVALPVTATIAGASGCGGSGDRGGTARAGMRGEWAASFPDAGTRRDSLALQLDERPADSMVGTGARWLGDDRLPLVVHGRRRGDTLVLAVKDSGARAVEGPATLQGVRVGDTLAATFVEGPFARRITLRRAP